MKLTSTAFEHEGVIPTTYTCEGKNINPPLTITEVPEEAISLVLIMDDPDVPLSIRSDGVWDHWLIWNMPATTTAISENSTPSGVIGQNTRGAQGYGGPCPPDKEHRYFFKLYALDTELDLSTDASKSTLETAMEGHILTQAILMGRYNKITNQ